MRPKLSAVLLHPYFNHEFVLIHSFLFELPLKSIQQKQDFFTGLIDRLRYFDEEVVGAQLATDLLSRMVLLDPTAQLCVTPYVLKTRTSDTAALFSAGAYKKYIMPQILRMFRLRDAQIRLILLEYFMEYVRLLDKAELEEAILPHLLLGMNDTNDVLVAKTLRCLADLIPILGSAAVIGGQRSRLFSDGRPQAAVSADTAPSWVGPRSITPVMGNNLMDYMVSGSPLPQENEEISGSCSSLNREEELLAQMPARLSPDGGEDDKSLSILTDGGAAGVEKNYTVLSNNIKTESPAITPEHVPIITDKLEDVFINENYTKTESYDNLDPPFKQESNFEDNEEEEHAWSDWETEELQHLQSPLQNDNIPLTQDLDLGNNLLNSNSNSFMTLQSQTSMESVRTSQSQLSTNNKNPSKSANKSSTVRIIDDLNALDIQVQKTSVTSSNGISSTEFDFFKDMEPIIKTSNNHSLVIDSKSMTTPQTHLLEDEDIKVDTNRFAAASTALNSDEASGWDMEDNDAWSND